MSTLVYLSGEPGVGKSTLMARLTAPWKRSAVPPSADGPARDALIREAPGGAFVVEAVEIGRRRDSFSGTDALPQTVITVAEEYLVSGMAAAETDLLLAEGARLANRRFLTAAVDSGWDVVLVHLHGAQTAELRRRDRADRLGVPAQQSSWVKGRRTAAANLADQCLAWGVQTVLSLDVDKGEDAAVHTLTDLLRMVGGFAVEVQA